MALTATFVACEKNELEIIPNDTNGVISEFQQSDKEIQLLLAKSLRESLENEGNELLSILTELSNEQFDMDYDVLGVPFLKSLQRGSFRSSSILSLIDEDIMNSIEKEYPLLNFYIPFTIEDFENANDYLIVLWPELENDGKEYHVEAINKKGERLTLSSLEEPALPYIVIGYNERVQLIDNEGDLRSSNQPSTLYKTNSYIYILPEQFDPKNYVENRNLFNNIETRSGGYRNTSAYGMSEMIKSARFASLSAIDRVEGWGKGQPEVSAKVAFYKVSDPTLEKRILDLLKNVTNDEEKILKTLDSFSKDLIHGEVSINMDNQDWFSGSRWGGRKIKTNYGNWKAFRWNEQGLPSMCKYKFYEMDGKSPVEPSVSFKGVTITFKINAGTQDIGEGTVFYADPLGIEYSVSGNNFFFTIDQEQRY